MLQPTLTKNDKKAYWLIGIFSVVVFVAVSALTKITLNVELPFDKHIFGKINAILNSLVSICLVYALVQVKQKNYIGHKKTMMTAMVLSILFLVSYIAHHLFAGETKFGGEGTVRIVYLILLATHIVLAGGILPFILFSAYRGMTAEFDKHRKLVKYTWPLWFYVSVTGVIVYFMISPYYQP